jgi:hypothetical protein
MNLTKHTLLSTLLMALSVSAFAQLPAAPETTSSTTMAVSGQDNRVRTYAVKNLAVSASTNFSGYGQITLTQDVSVSLVLPSPPDATMLKWMKQGSSDSAKKVVITVKSKDAKGAVSEIKYVLDAARIIGFSAYHTSNTPAEFSLQLAATNLVINGVPD